MVWERGGKIAAEENRETRGEGKAKIEKYEWEREAAFGIQEREGNESGRRGGDEQRRDFEREEGETGLRNPCISIPLSLYGREERMEGEWERDGGGEQDKKN